MVSGVSILNVSVLTERFSLLRSSKASTCWALGLKLVGCKTPEMFGFGPILLRSCL